MLIFSPKSQYQLPRFLFKASIKARKHVQYLSSLLQGIDMYYYVRCIHGPRYSLLKLIVTMTRLFGLILDSWLEVRELASIIL